MLDGLADLLENARDANDDGGADFAHGLRELVELRAINHLRAGVVHHVVKRAGGDVREGEERDAGVGCIEAEIDGGDVLVGGHVAVGEGDAFGLAGCAGGVDEGGEVLWLDGADESIEDGVALRTEDIDIVHQGAEGGCSVGRGRIHDDDAL